MRYLLALLLLILSVTVDRSDGTALNTIIGAAAECPIISVGCNPIPLTLTTLCSVNCSVLTQPSFTDENRIWGGNGANCRTSTNGGVTFANCTTQPFSSGARESYAGAKDGSVIGTGNVGGVNCTIKRSTDNAITWTTVYTDAGVSCGGALTAQTEVKCLADESCTFVHSNGSTLTVRRSTDNGQNWSIVTTVGPFVVDVRSYTHTTDISIVPGISAGFRGGVATGATWLTTGLYPVGTSACLGSFVLGGVAYASCYQGPGSVYAIRDGSTGAIISTPTIEGALASAGSGGVTIGYGSNVVYLFASWVPPSGNSPIGVWVSRDSGITFTFLGIGSALANSMGGGDVWQSPINGCIYLSAGISNSQFIRIC